MRQFGDMSTVSVELPSELAAELGTDDVSMAVCKLVALELFRENKLSLVRAAELLAMNINEFQELVNHYLAPVDTSIRDSAFDWRKVKGKYAHLKLNSERFMDEKREGLARENRE